jgi:hypothetical protein
LLAIAMLLVIRSFLNLWIKRLKENYCVGAEPYVAQKLLELADHHVGPTHQ